MSGDRIRKGILGAAALSFSVLYLASELVEVLHGGYSGLQLSMAIPAEAAAPVVVVGLCMIQRPRFALLGQVGTLAYACCSVFLAFTTLYALVAEMPNAAALSGELGPLMVANSAIMVLGGIAFGVGMRRAEVFPRWTAQALMGGVVLVAVTQGAPDFVQLFAVTLREAGFVGMGFFLVRVALRPKANPLDRSSEPLDLGEEADFVPGLTVIGP